MRIGVRGAVVTAILVGCAVSFAACPREYGSVATPFPVREDGSLVGSPSLDLSVDSEPARSPASIASAEEQPFGEVSVLRQKDGRPWDGEPWRVVGATGGSPRPLSLTRAGLARVPVGRWTLLPPKDDLVPFPRVVELEARGHRATVFVAELLDLSFHAVTPEGMPIEGVHVSWRSRSLDGARAADVIEATTGTDGVARFPNVTSFGEAELVHDDYRQELRSVNGGAAELHTVVMWPHAIGVDRWLEFHAVHSDAPLAGVTVSLQRRLLGVSDGDGRVLVPGWVEPGWLLTLAGTAAGAHVVAPDEASVLRLPDRVEGTVCARGGTGSSFSVRAAPGATSVGDVTLLPTTAAVEGNECVPLSLPREVETSIHVRDEAGWWAESELLASAPGWRETLTMTHESTLVIELVDRLGAPVPASHATFRLRDQEVRIEATPELRIPYPNQINSIVVASRDAVEIGLRAYRDFDRSGTIRLVVDPAEALVVAVKSEGEPVSGVRVSADCIESGLQVHPDRGGGWPSGHPGWSVVRDRITSVVTDSRGEARFELRPMRYQLSVSQPEWIDANTYWLAALAVVDVARDRFVELEVPLPRHVTLEVFEQSSGTPVRGFEILQTYSSPTWFGTSRSGVRGARWEGWLAAGAESLVVAVDGVGSTKVDFAPGLEPVIRKVYIVPQPPTIVRFDGLEAHAGEELQVEVLERVEGPGWMPRASATMRIDERGDGVIVLPFVGDELMLDFPRRVAGKRARFDPPEVEVAELDAIVVRCTFKDQP